MVSVLSTSNCGITKAVNTFHLLDGSVLVNRTQGDRAGTKNWQLHGGGSVWFCSQCLPQLFTANIEFHYPARTLNYKGTW